MDSTVAVPETVSSGPPAGALAHAANERLSRVVLDGRGPIWLQIRRALVKPIASGEWPAGSLIPGEVSLVDHLGVARMTVVKAVQSLANEGLVERRRKVGTVVAARSLERPTFEIWDICDVIAKSGAVYGYQLLSCAFVHHGAEERALLGVGREAVLLRMICLHTADGLPFQLEDRIINADAAPGVTCQPLETAGPGPWLIAHVPWTQAEHVISACPADPETAKRLKVASGACCLVVERKTWNETVPVTFARLWHPGSSHRLVGRFEPSR